jgi:hypothetical protein
MNTQLSNLIIIDTISFCFYISTVLKRHFLKKDVIRTKDYVIYKCDIWCIGHVFQYICLGYLSPDYWIITLLISILFEYFELILSKNNKYVHSQQDTDPLINSFGFLVGVLLQKAYPSNISLLNIINKSFSF